MSADAGPIRILLLEQLLLFLKSLSTVAGSLFQEGSSYPHICAFHTTFAVRKPDFSMPAAQQSLECHMVPTRFTNTPLWLYFRSVRSSEKPVKL